MPFALLAKLWLHEPDAATAAQAAALLRLPPPDPAELAEAHAGLFLLNVYPYGTVFSDPSGELNGPGAQYAARLYAAHGYQPPELRAVGAPDHLGLGLGFLGHLRERGQPGAFGEACAGLLAWAPVACLAVQRDPQANGFYRALAAHTAEALLLHAERPKGRSAPSPAAPDDQAAPAEAGEEVRLWHVVSFFLAPARCGIFLSRSRLGHMAQALGLALPFGARYDVAQRLFQAAGEAEQVTALLDALAAEVAAWAAAYRSWARDFPAWAPTAAPWLARTEAALQRLEEMKRLAGEA